MGKHVFYTEITPLPSNIPRLLALDLLHSHDEWIRLNPLVTDVKPIDPPRNAEGDEYFSSWYQISEVLNVGIKKKVHFNGCFHNQSWGMQSHVFAPLGIEFRNKYRIGGNQPGEPREARELGVKTPMDGLYLREDISFNCSSMVPANFVKKEMQDASKTMIDRMKRKAELLDEGKLHAMFEDGRLKTQKVGPNAPAPTRASTFIDPDKPLPSPGASVPGSPPPQWDSPYSQQNEFKPPGGYQNYGNLVGRTTSQSARSSYVPSYQQPGYGGPDGQRSRPNSDMPGQWRNSSQGQPQEFVSELEGSYYQPQQSDGLYPPPLKSGTQMSFRSELPGDSYYATVPEEGDGESQQPPTSTSTPPPNSTHPAYRHSSPRPSPLNPGGGSVRDSARSSSYQIANPDQQGEQGRQASYSASQAPPTYAEDQQQQSQQRPDSEKRQNSRQSVQDWQRSVENDAPIDESYYRNSRHSHGQQQSYSVEPDSQRMQNMTITDDRETLPSQRTSKCPVCGLFEGDEAAVSHHVTQAHFK